MWTCCRIKNILKLHHGRNFLLHHGHNNIKRSAFISMVTPQNPCVKCCNTTLSKNGFLFSKRYLQKVLPTETEILAHHQPIRSFLTAVSATGFNDYELGCKNFQLDVPEYFNFAQVLDDWATKEKTGERATKNPALWCIDDNGQETKWTFQDLQSKSKKVANILEKACGVKKGDVVMLILPRVPEWFLVNVGCLRTGTILCPGTTLLRSKDIKQRLIDSKTTCIIADESVATYVDEVAGDCTGLKSKLLVSQTGETRDGWLDFKSLNENASEAHECVVSKSTDPTIIFFTSGTTGLPKMVEHTQAYGLAHQITGKYWLDLTPIDIHWNMSDTGWAKSAWSVYPCWIQGACIFAHNTPKFDAVKTLQILDQYPVSTFCGAPTIFRMFVQENLSLYNLTSLRHILSAGEPLNPEIIDEWRNRVGHIIREGYGQTETVVLCGSFRCLPLRPGSMGKAVPGCDLCIVDDDGNEVGPGQEGHIGVRVKPKRPLGLFNEYINDPERTNTVFKGDFYLTGDKAKKDEDGFFWFVARGDDVITSAGYRIGPFEVESALIEHPAVAESAAISSPDELRGEVVKAFVVLSSSFEVNDEEALKEELKKHVQNTTAPYKYPRKIEFVDSLPKTVSGKIRRVELRNNEWSK